MSVSGKEIHEHLDALEDQGVIGTLLESLSVAQQATREQENVQMLLLVAKCCLTQSLARVIPRDVWLEAFREQAVEGEWASFLEDHPELGGAL